MPKYKYIFFQIKCTEAISSKSTRKLLQFEISEIQLKNKFIVLFVIIFGILSSPMYTVCQKIPVYFEALSRVYYFRTKLSKSII